MPMTAYHARYYAYLLTKRAVPNTAERYLPADRSKLPYLLIVRLQIVFLAMLPALAISY